MPLSAARTLLCGPRYALNLDGVDDYVEVSDSPSLNPTDEITVMGWFYLRGPTGTVQNGVRKEPQYMIFHIDAGYSSVYVFIQRTDGVWNNLRIARTVNVEGKWTNVAMTYKSNGEFKGYLNGELAAETTLSALPIRVTTYPLQIGRQLDGYFFNGIISEVLIYSRALSDKEVAWNFNHRDNPVRSGLVLWLHWDSIDIDTGMWYDKSAFSNHGTIYGATLAEPIRLKARTLSPVRTLTPVR